MQMYQPEELEAMICPPIFSFDVGHPQPLEFLLVNPEGPLNLPGSQPDFLNVVIRGEPILHGGALSTGQRGEMY